MEEGNRLPGESRGNAGGAISGIPTGRPPEPSFGGGANGCLSECIFHRECSGPRIAVISEGSVDKEVDVDLVGCELVFVLLASSASDDSDEETRLSSSGKLSASCSDFMIVATAA